VVIGAVLCASGCSVRAQALRSQPLAHAESVDGALQTDRKILIYPFEDLRGGEYGFLYPTSLIPIVNFFHLGSYNNYPEQSAILVSDLGGRASVTVGALDSAMPFLMAEMMRKMRLTNNVTPLAEINTKTELSSYDYVIRGKLRVTTFDLHVNIIPLGILAILGVPYQFPNFELAYEVTVTSSARPATPIFQKTYSFDDSTVIGLYYNQQAAYEMFIKGLEETLPQVVNDVAVAIKRDGG
jgi:hypothetical protein